MTQAAMAVTYRLTEATRQDDARTLKDQFTAAAPVIAATPGLSWKISAIDAGRGVGLGLYLFDSGQNARVGSDRRTGRGQRVIVHVLRNHLARRLSKLNLVNFPALIGNLPWPLK